MSKSNPVSLARYSTFRTHGLYLTVRQNDHTVLSRLLAEDRLQAKGLLLDARYRDQHQSLQQEATRNGISTWLDTQAMELALPSGITQGHAALPWAKMPKTAEEFITVRQRTISHDMAAFAVEGKYSGILAPTHYLTDDTRDWIDKDIEMTRLLREQLDAMNGSNVEIIYPLAVSTRMVSDAVFRDRLIRIFRNLPIDIVSLRIHPFGYRSGPNVVRAIVGAIRHLRQSQRSLLIERAGFAGLGLFAVGAVDFVESGVAIGDSFDIGYRLRPEDPSSLTTKRKKRIYLEALGMAIDLKVAEKLISAPHGKSRFACKNTNCCPNGARDMMHDPRRHSVLARQREFQSLARMPVRDRGALFLQNFMTPVCDTLFRAGDFVESFKDTHRRILSIKDTYSALLRDQDLSAPSRLNLRSLPRALADVITLPPRDPIGR